MLQRHSRSLLFVHLVWSTRRRAEIIAPAADLWIADVLSRKADAIGGHLVASGNASDHVHVVVQMPATLCLADIARHLKGAASYAWNTARRASASKLVWQTGYWAQSVNPDELPVLVDYLARQRVHHGTPAAPEPWEAFVGDPSPTVATYALDDADVAGLETR